MRVGPNPQAHAVLASMLRKGLIVETEPEVYAVTKRGKHFMKKFVNEMESVDE